MNKQHLSIWLSCLGSLDKRLPNTFLTMSTYLMKIDPETGRVH